MKRIISILLSATLLMNLVGCGNENVTQTEPNEIPRTEEKVPQIPQIEDDTVTEEDTVGEIDIATWLPKETFVLEMQDIMDEYGMEYSYTQLSENYGSPMFVLNDHVGICGYLDENGNVVQITVIASETTSLSDFEMAGQLYGMAIKIFTGDSELIDEITTIFDENYGAYETNEFIYEYSWDGVNAIMHIFPKSEMLSNGDAI